MLDEANTAVKAAERALEATIKSGKEGGGSWFKQETDIKVAAARQLVEINTNRRESIVADGAATESAGIRFREFDLVSDTNCYTILILSPLVVSFTRCMMQDGDRKLTKQESKQRAMVPA